MDTMSLDPMHIFGYAEYLRQSPTNSSGTVKECMWKLTHQPPDNITIISAEGSFMYGVETKNNDENKLPSIDRVETR